MTIAPPLLSLLPGAVRARLEENGGRLCLSGAARGADAHWAALAWRRGDAVVHWSFAGHHRARCAGETVLLSADELALADEHLARAARPLGRPWPPRSSYAADLLRRDWLQVVWSRSVYAVGEFGTDRRIGGGTAWTVQMFLDRFGCEACAAYLFDQRESCWLAFGGRGWAPIAAPPVPEGVWAGVGTRGLKAPGIAAMEPLMREAA